MERRYLLATIGIVAILAIGLVGYFEFSALYGDGLDKTMQEGGVTEGEQVYHAPFDYGGDYLSAFVAGLIGFAATLGVVYGYLKISRRAKKTDD